jgi:copper(I)-binding protein
MNKPALLNMNRRLLGLGAALAVLGLAGASAFGHGTTVGSLHLDHPYAVPSLAGVNHGAAYLRGIKNKGQQPDKLLGASSDVAARVELHRMQLDAGVMRMREVPFIALPAGQTTLLRHGGEHHLMLMDLKRPLKDGDRFDMTLNFERAGSQTVRVWVQTPRDGRINHAAH